MFHRIFILCCLAILFVPYAQAQDIAQGAHKRTDTQTSAALTEMNSYPLHYGSFAVQPKLILQQQYNTNVLARSTNERDDFVTTIQPSLNIFKNIRDHQFNLNLQSSIIRYADLGNESIENHRANFDARVIATKRASLPITIEYQRGHRERNQERATVQSRAPVAFDRLRARTGFEFRPNRLLLGVYGSYELEQFDNATAVNGTRLIREDGDFSRYGIEAIARYTTHTNWSPFASILVAQSDFKRRSFNGVGFNGLARDNTLIRGLTGIGYDYKGLISASLAFGADHRNFTDTNVSDVNDIVVEGRATWQPRRGTSVIFDASRQTQENNEINNGLVQTNLAMEVDYELQQDLFLRGNVLYEHDKFNTGGRDDDLYGAGMGLYYVLNPKFQLEGRVDYNQRNSNQIGAEFDQTTFMMRLVSGL